VRRVLRAPALHFAVLGTALFVLQQRLAPSAPAGEVVIPATRIGARERLFERDLGRAPTADERAALVADEVDQEVLYREALARALDRDDRSIRGHLAEKMRFLEPAAGEDAADSPALAQRAIALGLDRSDAFVRRVLVEKMRLLTQRASEEDAPDDAALAAFMAEHPDRWRLPARVTVQHVFLRDDDAARAGALLTGLRAGSVDFASAGDPFHTGHVVPDAARPMLVNLLGEAIAEHALTAPLGAWAGPFRSPWGVHLVRVAERTDGALPAVGQVRSRLVLAWREERRQARARAALVQLRRQWRIRVEDGA